MPSTSTFAEEAWLEVSELLNLQLSPLGQRAIDALAPKQSDVIVDIGCGAGQTVLQLAERVGPTGQVIGVDIAPLLLERARARAAGLTQTRFIERDATTLHLPSNSVDGIYSRFGVMRFANPVAAFRNFHSLMKPSGTFAFVCWRSLEENELDILPICATGLEEHVDKTPFSFEDRDVLHTALKAADFKQVLIEPYDCAVSSGGVEEMLKVLLKVGAVGKIVRERPELRQNAESRLRPILASKTVANRCALNAAVWVVSGVA